MLRIYFDTSSWMRPSDQYFMQPFVEEDVAAVFDIITLKKEGKIFLALSKKVEEEIDRMLEKDQTKIVKAKQTKQLISLAGADLIFYPSFNLGERINGILHLSRLGNNEEKNFRLYLKKDDYEIAQFVVRNDIRFLVTANTEHFMKPEVQQILKKHGCESITPRDLMVKIREGKIEL